MTFLKKGFYFMTLLSVNFLLTVSAENNPSELNIHQTAFEGEELISFISINDSEGNLIKDISEENFIVNYGEDPGNVLDLKKFDSRTYGTAYTFMVDVSKSVRKNNFNLIKQSILEWIDSMNPGDAVSIITFGEDVIVLKDFSYDRNELIETVNNLTRTDLKTRLHDGLIKAHNLSSIRNIKLPTRRAIICLTDGVNEFIGGATKREVIETLSNNRLPIYTIGFTENLDQERRQGIEAMAEFARASGGLFFDANKLSIEGAYRLARNRIDATYMLYSSCDSCDYDGSSIKLYLSVSFKNVVLDAAIPLQLLSSKKTISPFQRGEREKTFSINYQQGLMIGIASILILIVVIGFFVNRKKSVRPSSSPESAANPSKPESSSLDDFVPSPSNKPVPFSSEYENFPTLKVEMKAVSHNMDNRFEFEVGSLFSLGRSSSCDLSIKDQSEISGTHCSLSFSKGLLFVKDNNSTNGTFLNGVRITQKHVVNSKDLLGLGRVEFRLLFVEEKE